jgi:hypothetical protein
MLTVCLLLLALAPNASAQSPAAQSATAEALFHEAKELMADGKADKACPKLEESLRLDPAIGTRYQLGKCYELTHRYASAWTLYLEVAAEAHAAHQPEREEFARNEARKLEAKLSHLTVTVPNRVRVDGLVVKRNGLVVGKGQWGTKVPVDPGSYSFEVSAPGKRPRRMEVQVHGPGGSEELVVPELENAPLVKMGETPQAKGKDTGVRPTPSRGEWSPRHTGAVTSAALGVVGLGVTAWFGLKAKRAEDRSQCDPACDSPAALDQNKDARRYARIADVAGGVGLILIGTGAVLYFTLPDAEAAPQDTVALRPVVGPRASGFEVSGRF